MSYRYKLFKNGRERGIQRYTLNELTYTGTFMLRDICVREKIMTRSAGIDPKRLDRDALIELLFRYRGKEEETLADGFWEESVGLVKDLSSMAVLASQKLEIPNKIEIKKEVPMLEAWISWRVFCGNDFGCRGKYFGGIRSQERAYDPVA